MTENIPNRDSNASGIRDNHTRGAVAAFLKETIRPGAELSVVSAYFTIYAYDLLRGTLNDIEHLNFLFGEPSFIGRLDPEKDISKAFVIDASGLSLANRLEQRRVARECAQWIERKVTIRTVRQSNLLHGKLYHIANGGVEDAIVGSSNFTVRGLGLARNSNNIELNLVVDSKRDRRDLHQWFTEVWNDETLVEDVTDRVLAYLGRLYSDQSPQFIYYLTLYHLFRDFLDGTRDIEEDLRRVALPETRVWQTLYSFQKDGAKAAINKLLAYNGCILADSVGLGKTYTALAVIKYFELRNERVLVLCPKKLTRNWTLYRSPSSLNPFTEDRFRYDVLHHTDLSRTSGSVNGIELDTLNWGAYDLVVIDESHNFRNNKHATERPGETTIRKSRYERLMDDIVASGVRTKVLLVSATPVNNQLADLRNQISFIAGGDVARQDSSDGAFAETLGIASVRETSRYAQAQFTAWAKKPVTERKTRDLIAGIGGDFFRLLDGLSIARSRSQIATYYAEEMIALGGFPDRPPPKAVHPPIDLRQKYLSFEQLNAEIDELRLALYHPSSFLRSDVSDDIRTQYENKILGGFTQEGRERILVAMMKINFLKRLESSVDSFRLTLGRTIAKIDILERRIRDFEQHVNDNPDVDYDLLTPDKFEDPDFDTEEFTIGGRRRIHLAHLDLARWLQAVTHDRAQLQFLLDKTQDISAERDGKLSELKRFIEEKARNPSLTRDGRSNRKVLVFTAFADTATYLHKHLKEWLHEEFGLHCALVTGGGSNESSLGRTDFDDILTNFSPIAKRRAEQILRFPEQEAEIDLLIATDCISEGQNLQDCDLLVNFDIHWNPVRIIQRFGRIDRIGSRNASVQLVNFWPVADLDKYLGVKHRVEARMALVDLAATQTDNLLDTEQIEDLIKQDMLFRDRQLKRLKDEVLNLEDLDGSISLTDFSLDEFRLDLLRFLEANRSQLEDAGEGLYAVVPAPAEVAAAQPGVLFCLRHNGTKHSDGSGQVRPREAARINPLAPYVLVYVHDDGTVRYTFAQPKEAMLLFRDLAAGASTAFVELCERFDRETHDGTDMSHYSRQLSTALDSVRTTAERRVAAGLFRGRGGTIPKASSLPTSAEEQYDLVTWLAILAPERQDA